MKEQSRVPSQRRIYSACGGIFSDKDIISLQRFKLCFSFLFRIPTRVGYYGTRGRLRIRRIVVRGMSGVGASPGFLQVTVSVIDIGKRYLGRTDLGFWKRYLGSLDSKLAYRYVCEVYEVLPLALSTRFSKKFENLNFEFGPG